MSSNGSICPLLITFNCIAVDTVAENLRWYFNDESVAIYTYEEDDEYPLNVTLSTPIPGVMIQIVQASLDATSFSFNSTMTANLSVFIQEGVSNISCGSRIGRSKAIDIQGIHRIPLPLLCPKLYYFMALQHLYTYPCVASHH